MLPVLFGSQAQCFTFCTESCPAASFKLGDKHEGPFPAGQKLALSPHFHPARFGSGCPTSPGLHSVSTGCQEDHFALPGFFFCCVFLKIQQLWSRQETNRNAGDRGCTGDTQSCSMYAIFPWIAWKTCMADFPALLCTNACCLLLFLTLQQASKASFSSHVMLQSRKFSLISLLPFSAPYGST